jgi:hypothetical protein
MDQAKIRLSPTEMELLRNGDWILTKNGIMRKAWELLEIVKDSQEVILKHSGQIFSRDFAISPGKISKGENYRGLPYLVLDNPRYFNRDHILAIRTMFWWGNFFSVTLHLCGQPKKMFSHSIILSFPYLKHEDFYVCVHESEWEHHFEAGNYLSLSGMEKEEFEFILETKPFLKLSKKIPLEKWDDAPEILAGIFGQLLLLMNDQLPRR